MFVSHHPARSQRPSQRTRDVLERPRSRGEEGPRLRRRGRRRDRAGGPGGLPAADQRQRRLGDRRLGGGRTLLGGLVDGGRSRVVVRGAGPPAGTHAGQGDRAHGAAAGLGQPHLQADLGQQVGELDVQGVADRGEQLGGGLLLPALDLREVAEADPGCARDVAQRPPLPQPVTPQGVPQLGAQQRHGRLLSTLSREHGHRTDGPPDTVCSPYAAMTLVTVPVGTRPLMA